MEVKVGESGDYEVNIKVIKKTPPVVVGGSMFRKVALLG